MDIDRVVRRGFSNALRQTGLVAISNDEGSTTCRTRTLLGTLEAHVELLPIQ